MGEEHNVVFGQGPRVNRAKSTLTSPTICLMRHMEGEVGVLLALLTLGPCPKTTLCSSPIDQSGQKLDQVIFAVITKWPVIFSYHRRVYKYTFSGENTV